VIQIKLLRCDRMVRCGEWPAEVRLKVCLRSRSRAVIRVTLVAAKLQCLLSHLLRINRASLGSIGKCVFERLWKLEHDH
jgi:hypothetical protein